MAEAAPASGFGRRVWVEVVDSSEAMAAYLVKVAEEFSRSAFKVGDQRPLGAPRHFRRMRASRGLLPARKRFAMAEHVDERTGEVTWTPREASIPSRGMWTAILANVPYDRFDDRAPTWTDVAEAREFQYLAAKRRQGRAPSPSRFE